MAPTWAGPGLLSYQAEIEHGAVSTLIYSDFIETKKQWHKKQHNLRCRTSKQQQTEKNLHTETMAWTIPAIYNTEI